MGKYISNMRTLLTEDFVEIPDGVTVNTKAREVTVKGERGSVTKDFSHLAVELQKMKLDNKKRKGTFIRIRMWFGGYKQACSVNTLKSLIENMITGVTEVSQVPIQVQNEDSVVSVSDRVKCSVFPLFDSFPM